MNDYEEQLFGGTPQVTDEMREQFRLEAEQNEARIRELQPEQADTLQEKPLQATAIEEPVVDQTQPQQLSTDNTTTELSPEALALANRMDAFGQSWIDAGADFLNLLPFVNLPKASRYEDDVAEGIRNVSQIVLPTLLLNATGIPLLTKGAQAYKGVGAGLLQDKGFQFAGRYLFSAGTGALSDYAAQFNEEDDNLSGFLKKTWPKWWGWIPDDIATLDDDHPNVKKRKNITEGVGLGIGPDFALGAAKLLRGLRGIDRASKYVPENEKAKNWFAKRSQKEDTAAEVIENSTVRRSRALDELGQYNFDKAVNFDEPILGYHDVYGHLEQGTRTADPYGIVGVSVDSLRLVKDNSVVDGRVGSVITEAALKKGLESSREMEIVVRGQAEILKDAGQYGYDTADGKYLSFKEVIENGDQLAQELFELDTGSMKLRVRDFQKESVAGPLELKDEGYAGVFKAIKLHLDEYMNMDYVRAHSWIAQSFSGQVSDMAQGVRLVEETRAIERAQEQILDRLEFLLAQKGITSYLRGRALNMLNLWDRMTAKGSKAYEKAERKRIAKAMANEENPTLAAIERIKQDSGTVVDTLRSINGERPELLSPLMMAYEFSNGKINTISKLNNYVRNSTGLFKKAFVDMQPEIPSVLYQGIFANIYNAALSAFATPIKAGGSAAYLLAEKPIAAFAGAIRTDGFKNGESLQKAWYVYTSSILETLKDATKYMGHVYKKSGTDPYVVAMREDQGDRNEKALQIINSFANAHAEKGDFGPQVMAEIINNINDVAQSPFMRFGNRAMQAFDGFTGSVVAVAEAKSQAWEEVTKGGKLPLDKARANELARQVKAKMFDQNGLITDEAVLYATGEIAMNLDNAANKNISAFIRRAPILKPFLLFTKTPLNELAMMAQRTPLGLFVNDLNKFKLPAKDMSGDEVNKLLVERGVTITDDINPLRKYDDIRRELLGRKAMGMLYTSLAAGLVVTDQIHGHGNYNRQVQKLRREAGWKPLSIVVPGGQQVSYANLGPFSNWLALVADIGDNFDSLSSREIGELLKKMGFILASSITEKTSLAALEPFTDVLTGNVGAINKWAASFLTSALVPGNSQLAEISRLMDPGLKEVDLELHQLVFNRNPITKGLLPKRYDWIDGGEVGIPDNFLARVWNTYTPWKVNGKISKRKQFLIDIEYDGRPAVNTNGKGIEYTPEERSEILNIIGRDNLFGSELDKIIQDVEASGGTKGFRTRMQKALGNSLLNKSGAVDVGEFESLHLLIDKALRNATTFARAKLPTLTEQQTKVYVQDVVKRKLQAGDVESAERFMKYMEEEYSF